MAIHLTTYVAPLVGGAAYVVPESTLAALRGAAQVLAGAPQPLELVVCVPAALQDSTPDRENAVRALYRRAAVAASAQGQTVELAPFGIPARFRWALLAFGWLLLLSGGAVATGIGGFWLAIAYPLLRQTLLGRALPGRVAAPLAHPVGVAPIVVRPHTGLTSLGQLIHAGAGSSGVLAGAEVMTDGGASTERYRKAAAACVSLGLGPLADFYGALARGAEPPMMWAAEERADGSFHEPA